MLQIIIIQLWILIGVCNAMINPKKLPTKIAWFLMFGFCLFGALATVGLM